MTESSSAKFWGLGTATEIGAAFRGVNIALTAQDSGLTYTAVINPFGRRDPQEDLLGLSDEALFTDAPGQELIAIKRRVSESGRSECLDFHFVQGDDSKWYRVSIEPLAMNGSGRGVLAASVDVTAEKTAEEHLRLALLELAHRSKNLLAVVLSIARQSAEDSEDLAHFNRRFVGRIRSLALAHDILTDEAWRGATVLNLVRSQLSAFSDTALEQSTVVGHNAFLKPNAVQYVGLALHELVSLSIISGALSSPDGRVEFESRLVPPPAGSEGHVLVLSWKEAGRLGAIRPEATRFGHALLERIVPAALGGSAEFDPAATGFAYELRLPASQFF